MVPQDEHHLPRRCAAVGPCDFSCSAFGHGSNNMGDTRYVTRARWKEGEGGVRLFSCHGDDDRDISDTAAKAMGEPAGRRQTPQHTATPHIVHPHRVLSLLVFLSVPPATTTSPSPAPPPTHPCCLIRKGTSVTTTVTSGGAHTKREPQSMADATKRWRLTRRREADGQTWRESWKWSATGSLPGSDEGEASETTGTSNLRGREGGIEGKKRAQSCGMEGWIWAVQVKHRSVIQGQERSKEKQKQKQKRKKNWK